MGGFKPFKQAWSLISRASTIKQVLEWFSLWKLVSSFLLTLAATAWAWISGRPGIDIFVIAVVMFAAAVWILNGITWRSEQQKFRRTLHELTANLPPIPQKEIVTDSLVLSNPYLKGVTFRLADLVRETVTIKSRTFEDCRIFGPLLLAPEGGMLDRCGFVGNVNDIFFAVKPPRRIIGFVSAIDCVFRKCYFSGIAILGTPEQVEKWKKAFAVEDTVNAEADYQKWLESIERN